MSQFVKIRTSYVNLEHVQIVQIVRIEGTEEVTVTWSNGTSNTYIGELAAELIRALEFLNTLSVSIPN